MVKHSSKKKIILFVACFFLLIFLITGGVGVYYYQALLSPNIFTPEKKKIAFNIPEKDMTPDDVIELLAKNVNVKSISSLKKAVKILQFNAVEPGHYVIHDNMNNITLVRLLRMGLQTPVKVTFNNIRTKELLASTLSKQLMCDSVEIISVLSDSVFLASYNFTKENAILAFIPNTYEFYWDTNGKDLFDRMYKEYMRFWNEERMQKAVAISLSSIEVGILASIVEEETNKSHEYPVVAGLYINRLNKGMLLQADPTVRFAVGDFSIKRILNSHLRIESPYNTYKNVGLPPGPIRIPSIEVVDAVLNYKKHNYIFMAAKPDSSGEHNFASTLSEHNRNANEYRQALNERMIY